MAAAVRLKRELKLEEVLAELDQIDFTVPRQPTKSLGSIQIEGQECFRFPSGTFFASNSQDWEPAFYRERKKRYLEELMLETQVRLDTSTAKTIAKPYSR